MKKKSLLALLAAVTFGACSKDDDTNTGEQYYRPATGSSSGFISKVLDYVPAPGQFINTDGLGNPAGAQTLIGGTDALVSLGGYGGYVVFGFDHSVDNKEGDDIAIVGNALTNPGAEWSEPGIVMVSQDKNGNGLADDEWYELAGSQYDSAGTIKNYKIIYYNPKKEEATDVYWKDNQGKSGYVLMNWFHSQPYYPSFYANQDSIIFEGTLLKSTLVKEYNDMYGTDLFVSKPFKSGYVDNGSPEYLAAIEAEGRGYNKFDIAAAIDKKGKKVTLKYVDFVKVYTGQNCNGDLTNDPDNPDRMMGEISTELSGAFDIHVKK